MLQKIQTLIQVIQAIAVEVQADLALTHNQGMTEMLLPMMMTVVQMQADQDLAQAIPLMKTTMTRVAQVVAVVR